MSEPPKKKKEYSIDLYRGGGTGCFSREIPVEWDVLAAASDRCLLGKGARGWLERERIRDTPASVLWRLWNYELGEMGTFEVRKLGVGRSQITFSGLGFLLDENGIPLSFGDERREIKQEHMRRIIEAYYFMLSQEDIFSEIEPHPTETKKRAYRYYVPTQPERWRNWQRIYNDAKLQDIYQMTGEYEGIEPRERWELIRKYVGEHYEEPTKIATLKVLFLAGDLSYLRNYEKDMEKMEERKRNNTE